jgi:transcriptional regulator with GAF, ATPase, and Fis domain
MARESLLTRTFVQLADNLLDEFDIAELLTMLAERCVEILDVSAAGVMLATAEGGLRIVASSSEAMRWLEVFELQASEGPCVECYRTRQPVLNQHLGNLDNHWPRFGPVALDAGFHSVHALPMRLRGDAIGALNLFRCDRGDLHEADIVAGQALADAATITVLQHRAVLERRLLNSQLSHALESRVVIEQAKGVLCERAGLTMEQAFARMRHHARSHNLKLVAVAAGVIDGSVTRLTLNPRTPPA